MDHILNVKCNTITLSEKTGKNLQEPGLGRVLKVNMKSIIHKKEKLTIWTSSKLNTFTL